MRNLFSRAPSLVLAAICLFVLAACGGGGGGGGGSASGPAPQSLTTFDANNVTQPGGVGHIATTEDNQPAVFSAISDINIRSLLNSPNDSEVDDDTTPFENDPDYTGTRIMIDGSFAGTEYRMQESDTASTLNGQFVHVYIDNRTLVSVGELYGFAFATLGEPFDASTLPTGTASYNGRVRASSGITPRNDLAGGFLRTDDIGSDFAMDVNFGTRQVTRFHVNMNPADGEITTDEVGVGGTTLPAVSPIAINPTTGRFSGGLNFGNGNVISGTSAGNIYGQFHGQNARGVSGTFHSDIETTSSRGVTVKNTIGGFAGAKVTP